MSVAPRDAPPPQLVSAARAPSFQLARLSTKNGYIEVVLIYTACLSIFETKTIEAPYVRQRLTGESSVDEGRYVRENVCPDRKLVVPIGSKGAGGRGKPRSSRALAP